MKMTKSNMADMFGVSIPTVNIWVRRGLPFDKKGSKSKEWVFDSADVTNWYADERVRNTVGDVDQSDEKELRRRKLAAETTVAEIAAAKAKGDVVMVDDVAKIISDDYTGLRARIRNIPSRVAPLIVGETDELIIKNELETEVNNALTELSNRFIDGESDSENQPAKASVEAAA